VNYERIATGSGAKRLGQSVKVLHCANWLTSKNCRLKGVRKPQVLLLLSQHGQNQANIIQKRYTRAQNSSFICRPTTTTTTTTTTKDS